MSQVSVAEVLEECGSIYRSIDIRVIAVRGEDGWDALFAVVRFSWLSPNEIRRRHSHLRRKFGIENTEHFEIRFAVYPFEERQSLFVDIADGMLSFGDSRMRLKQALDVPSQKNFLHRPLFLGGISADHEWPTLDVYGGDNPESKLGAKRSRLPVVNAGYQAASQALASICEVDTWPNSSYGYNLLIRLPVGVAIVSTKLQLASRELTVRLRRHKKFKDFKLHALVAPRQLAIPRDRVSVTRFVRGQRKGPTEEVVGLAHFETSLCREEYMDLHLSHPTLGELERQNHKVSALLQPVERNLLLEVLRLFCPLEELEELLTSPGAHPSARKGKSSAFEHHVAWVLSLLGFSVIVLGEHEHLKSGSVQQGSIDIIAVRGRTLVLAACTLSLPKNEDFGILWHVRAMLERQVVSESGVTILPVVVSGMIAADAFRPVGADTGIPIVDVDRLRLLVKDLPSGKAEQFLAFLAGPMNQYPSGL